RSGNLRSPRRFVPAPGLRLTRPAAAGSVQATGAFMSSKKILALTVALTLGSQAQAGRYHAPHTAWGAPDLDGTWTNFSLTVLERPAGVDKAVVSGAEAKALEHRMADSRANPEGDVVGNRPSEWWAEAPLARVDGGFRTSWMVSPT